MLTAARVTPSTSCDVAKRPKKRTAAKIKPAASGKKHLRIAAEPGPITTPVQSPQHTVTKANYGQLVGRVRQITDRHATLWGVPTLGPTVDLGAVARWTEAFLSDNAKALAKLRSTDSGESRADAERRKISAQADREELRLQLERGRVVDRQQAENQRLEMVRWMVGVFERAPVDLYARLAALEKSEIRQAVDDYFTKVREELVR